MIRSFNIDGCRRRKRVSVSGERGFMNFRCDGSNPPPCTIKRGDTVYLDVEFAPGEFPISFSWNQFHVKISRSSYEWKKMILRQSVKSTLISFSLIPKIKFFERSYSKRGQHSLFWCRICTRRDIIRIRIWCWGYDVIVATRMNSC